MRAIRIDSKVIEADIKYPGLASHGVKALAREGRKLASKLTENKRAGARPLAVDGPHVARDLQDDRRRSGQAKAEVLAS